MHTHVPKFIEFKNLLPKSPDLNSGGHKIVVTDQLKRMLIECWAQLIIIIIIII